MIINKFQILKEVNLSKHSLDRVIERIIGVKDVILPEGFKEFETKKGDIIDFFKTQLSKRIEVLKMDNRGIGEYLYSYVLARCYIKNGKLKSSIILNIDSSEGTVYYGSIVKNSLTTIVLSNYVTDDQIKRATIKNNPNKLFKEILKYSPNVDLIYDLTNTKEINNPIEISQLSENGKIIFNNLKKVKIDTISNLVEIENYIALANQFLTLNKTASESERKQISNILEKLNIKKDELFKIETLKKEYNPIYINLTKTYGKIFKKGKVESKQKKAIEFYNILKEFSDKYFDILPDGVKSKVSEMELETTTFLKTRKLMEEMGMDVSDF